MPKQSAKMPGTLRWAAWYTALDQRSTRQKRSQPCSPASRGRNAEAVRARGRCKHCRSLHADVREMSGTQFEAHSGSASAKKWKTSVRVEPGVTPEVPESKPIHRAYRV